MAPAVRWLAGGGAPAPGQRDWVGARRPVRGHGCREQAEPGCEGREREESAGGREPTDRERAGLGRVAAGGLLNLAGAALSAIATFAVTALIARGLGQAQAGVLFAATSAFLIGAVMTKLGTPVGLVYWLARLRALGRPDLVGACIRVAVTPVVVAGICTAGALWLAAPSLAAIAPAGSTETSDYVTQLRILAAFLPLAGLSDSLLAATRGYRTMVPTVLIDRFVRPSLQLLAVFGALLAAVSTAGYTLAWAGPYLPAATLAYVWLWALGRRARASAAAPPGDRGPADAVVEPVPAPGSAGGEGGQPIQLAREFWRFTAPRAVASVAQLALQRLDVVLVAALLGFAPAALYAVATRFLVVGQLVNQAVGTAVEPRLAELLTRDDRAAAKALYQCATGWLMLIAWPIYLVTAAFAAVYLSLFGPAYPVPSAITVVLTLCLAMLAATACGMVDVVLAMAGRTTWQLYNILAALAVNIAANVLLIPRLGIVGAAVAWALALLVKNAIPLAQITLALGLHPFGTGTLAAAALATVCVAAPALVSRLALDSGPLALGLSMTIGGAAYLLGAWRLRHALALPVFLELRRRGRTATDARAMSATEGKE